MHNSQGRRLYMEDTAAAAAAVGASGELGTGL